jgi:putative membrane protein
LRFVIRWLVTAAALIVAVVIVPGIDVYGNGWLPVLVTAMLLALINTFIRPVLAVLSCGCIVFTLGLFILVINAFTLWLASYITYDLLGLGFRVEGFWAAFFGALIVSIVSFVVNLVLPDEWTQRRESQQGPPAGTLPPPA